MNLQEFLLELAGSKGDSIKLDELLTSKVEGIEVIEEVEDGIRLLVEDPKNTTSIKERIAEVLDKAGYEQYKIVVEKDGPVRHISIEV
jgi:dissimilatory sulfite reductase (desulfoviridin) alpha/beta subunit